MNVCEKGLHCESMSRVGRQAKFVVIVVRVFMRAQRMGVAINTVVSGYPDVSCCVGGCAVHGLQPPVMYVSPSGNGYAAPPPAYNSW